MTSPAALLRIVPLAACVTIACGGRPPAPERGVLEQDVSAWEFRRYQQVVDIEVWVPDNEAIAHTASYVRKDAVKRGRLDESDVVNAFVTRYEEPAGILRALVEFARRLAQESGYGVQERKLSGVRVFEISGHGERWALWASDSHIVKVGGRGLASLPGDLVAAYAERYPSRVEPGMLEGPLPPGEEPGDAGDEEADPDSPRPDWDEYDPDEVNTPGKR